MSVLSPRQAAATRPGQFAMLRLPRSSDVILRRPMSIYDVKPCPVGPNGSAGPKHPKELTEGRPGIIQILYKVVGHGTQLMSDLKPGDQLSVLAPLGHGFFEEEYASLIPGVDAVLHVAGGIGIAALLMPAKALAAQRVPQRLFFGARTQWDLVGLQDYEPFTGEPVLSTEDGSLGHRGYITGPLEAFLNENRNKKYLLMICGPWAMLQAAVELAQRYGHPSLVSMENRMGCGLGVCLGCCIQVEGEGHGTYERVCTEGPVFRDERVVWEKETIPKT